MPISFFFSPIFVTLAPLFFEIFFYLYIETFSTFTTLVPNSTAYSNFWTIIALVSYSAGVYIGGIPRIIKSNNSIFDNANFLNFNFKFCCFLCFIAFFVYFRNGSIIIANITNAVGPIDLASASGDTRVHDLIPGVTSFVWACISALASFSLLFFKRPVKVFDKLLFCCIWLIVLLVSLVTAVRIMFIFSIITVAFIVVRKKEIIHKKIRLLKIIFMASFLFITFFIFLILSESLRSFAVHDNFSINQMIEYFLVPYFAKNIWNANQYINFSYYGGFPHSWATVASLYSSIGFTNDLPTPDMGDAYGTVTLLGLWYYDFGPFVSLVFIFLLGFISQYIYKRALGRGDFWIYLYSILLLCLLSFCRSNFFGSTAFMVCMLIIFVSPLTYLMLRVKKIK